MQPGNRRRVRRLAAAVAGTAILGSLAGCGRPPVAWPPSSPFPIEDIQLEMTFADLRIARPGILINPEDGSVEDPLYPSTLHYGFTSSGANGPTARSRLVYVDLVETDLSRERAESGWSSAVADLSADLGVEARCTSIENGRLTWRRATLRPADSRLAAAVEVRIVEEGPGTGAGELTTRMWLPEHATPLADDTAPPGSGNALPAWEPCAGPDLRSRGGRRDAGHGGVEVRHVAVEVGLGDRRAVDRRDPGGGVPLQHRA